MTIGDKLKIFNISTTLLKGFNMNSDVFLEVEWLKVRVKTYLVRTGTIRNIGTNTGKYFFLSKES